MKGLPVGHWVIFLGYLGILSAYYIYVYKKRSKTYNDFIIAGQKVPWYYVTGSLMATTISGATFLGCMGYVYMWGGAYWSITLGCLIAWLVISLYVGPKLRETGVITLTQYFMDRL